MAGRLAQLIADSAGVRGKTVIENAREMRIERLLSRKGSLIDAKEEMQQLIKKIDEETKNVNDELARLGIEPRLNKSKARNE